MGMGMGMGFELSPEQQLAQNVEVILGHFEDENGRVVHMERELVRLAKFISGNGDPKSGLLWAVETLDGRLTLLEAAATTPERRSSDETKRLRYKVTETFFVAITFGVIGLFGYGVVAWVQAIASRAPTP
jgi:hypothetical protein